MIDLEFAEGQEYITYDFTRCQRPDGSYYGTGGVCRSGAKVGAKEKAALKKAAKAGDERAAAALAVAEGKMSKEEANKQLSKSDSSKPKKSEPSKSSGSKDEKKDGGYTPKKKTEEKENVIMRAKNKLFGKEKNNIEGVGFKDQAEIKKSFEQRRKQIAKIDDPARRKKLSADLDKQEAAALKAHGNNKKFASDLKNELPRNVKTSIDPENGAIVMKSKVGKNNIEAVYSPSTGWNYQVNGGYKTGSVQSRQDQVRVANQVRQMFDATVRASPEGTVINTSAYSGDGKGAMRERAYKKLGFGKPDSKNTMYGVVKGGRVVPSNEAAAKSDNMPLRFAEDSQDQIWMDIIFPGDEETKK